MSYVLKVLGSTSQGLFLTPQYLRSGDVEAHDGLGTADLTPHEHEAKTFNDAGAAMKFWRQRSKKRPTRPDGKPNRPLTAFTVEVVKI